MLGKLYITPNSDGEKLQTALDLTTEAIDIKIASDAPSRNALNRLHTALSKAIGESAIARRGVEEETAAPEEEEAAPEATEVDDDTRMETVVKQEKTEAEDMLLEELLDDGEEL